MEDDGEQMLSIYLLFSGGLESLVSNDITTNGCSDRSR